MEFHFVELRCLAQASEDPERVRRAVAFALGLDVDGLDREDDNPEGADPEGPEVAGPEDGGAARLLARAGAREERIRGQFGNPISLISARLTKRREVVGFWSSFTDRAPPGVMEELRRGAEERTDDEFSFHFRLDKQAAYLGRLALGRGGDTIAVRCKPRVFAGGRAAVIEAMRGFFEGPGP